MKAPICGICLNSDMLCMACKKKFDSGEVTESDIRIARIINAAAKDFKPLDEVKLKKVIEGKNVALIICGKGDAAKLIGKDGIMIKKLSKLAKKPLRVLEETDDIKEAVKKLIYPVPLLRLNILYRPEGEMLKVVIPKGMGMPIAQEAFAYIIKLMFGKASVIANE
jgi:transcription antitermination factor NusA-like protein